MKKCIVALVLMLVFFSTSVGAYNFPEPDWGKLLNEKKTMVNQTDFELYIEGAPESSVYYGAKFEPPAGSYIGMVAETANPFLPLSSYLTYIQGMGQNDFYYPANQMIASDDVIPMVGWTINDLYSVDYNQTRAVLEKLNSYGKPMFIRFGNEMNVSSLGDDPVKYVEVFRKVADMIHEYPNLAVVWAPNDLGALDRPFDYFYPGDQYVDWIGVSCYVIKYFLGNKNTTEKDSIYFMTGDYGWATNRVKPIVDFMKKNNINKPLMICEGGVATGNKHGESLQNWAEPRLRNMLNYLIMKYPQIKMVNYFNIKRDERETFDISSYDYAVNVFNEAKNSGAYLTSYSEKAKFSYQPANHGDYLYGEDGVVKLRTLAYFPKNPNVSVTYYVDGNWYHVSNSIPYVCNIDMSSLSDGMHTLTIASNGLKKNYTFYKYRDYLRFAKTIDTALVDGWLGAQVSDEISVVVNGSKVSFDTQPFIENGRTLVPVRAIFEALGADVSWNGSERKVTSVRGNITSVLYINSVDMYTNGNRKVIDVPARIVSERTYVPVRAISESFGCSVEWNEAARTVIING